MKQYIITDLPEGLVNITADQLLEIGGSSGGSVYANTIPDTRIDYSGSNIFTIPSGVKLLYFNLNGGGQDNSWTQVGNVVTYTGTHVLVAGDYFMYAGNKSIEFLDDFINQAYLVGVLVDYVTKENSGQLVKVTKNGNTGYGLKDNVGKLMYSDIGKDAVDLNNSPWSGATGENSFATGANNKATQLGASVTGVNNQSNGRYSFTGGNGNVAESLAEFVIGLYASLISGSYQFHQVTDYIFRVGIGTYIGDRKDGFRVKKDGVVSAPSCTNALIDSSDGKTLTTKEWVVANVPSTKIELNRTLSPNSNLNTSNLIEGLPQYGREINSFNTTNIEVTVDAAVFATYFKGGSGTIKFVAGAGRTLKLMDDTDTINGIVGSYAKVKSFGTVDYIYINNY